MRSQRVQSGGTSAATSPDSHPKCIIVTMVNRQLARLSSNCRHRCSLVTILELAVPFLQRPYSNSGCVVLKGKANVCQNTITSTTAKRMASDEAYSAFLDQANQDTGARKASSKSSTTNIKATNTDVPPSLQNVERYYTSDADEPFEPVSLRWEERNMPSESMCPLE